MRRQFACPQACVLRCPSTAAPFLEDILKTALQFVKYDPNFTDDGDDDEAEAMDRDDVRLRPHMTPPAAPLNTLAGLSPSRDIGAACVRTAGGRLRRCLLGRRGHVLEGAASARGGAYCGQRVTVSVGHPEPLTANPQAPGARAVRRSAALRARCSPPSSLRARTCSRTSTRRRSRSSSRASTSGRRASAWTFLPWPRTSREPPRPPRTRASSSSRRQGSLTRCRPLSRASSGSSAASRLRRR